MKPAAEVQIQVGKQPAPEGYQYYQYDNTEYIEYINGGSDDEELDPLDRSPENHDEDDDGKFERVPLPNYIVTAVLQTAKLPEKVLKKLERSITQKYLNLCLSNIKAEDIVRYIVPFLKQYKDIKSLDLSSNILGSISIQPLCELELEALDVSTTYLTDEAVNIITQGMKLRLLDISNNDLSDDGALKLAKYRTLEGLDIASNKKITAVGMNALENVPKMRLEECKKCQDVLKSERKPLLLMFHRNDDIIKKIEDDVKPLPFELNGAVLKSQKFKHLRMDYGKQ